MLSEQLLLLVLFVFVFVVSSCDVCICLEMMYHIKFAFSGKYLPHVLVYYLCDVCSL